MRPALLISALLSNAALVSILAYQVFWTDKYPSTRFWLLAALCLSVLVSVPPFVSFVTGLDRVDSHGTRAHRQKLD